jgi:hypothetical protein
MRPFAIALTALCVGAPHIARAQTPARTVTLPLAEFNRLMDLANRPPTQSPVAPMGAVLASADLRVRIGRDTAQGVFTLAGDVLRDGVSRVPLIAGATLIDGTASGRPLPLAADGPMHTALLPGPGPFAVTLEWGAPLTFVPGRASFTLPVPPAGTARATLDVPGDQADVHVSPGLITRRSVTNGRTVVEVTLRPGSPAEVWWSMRDSAPLAATRDVRTLADVMTLVTIGDSDVRMVALVDVTVVQGNPRSIEVRLPPGYELLGVSGPSLASSDQREGGLVLNVDPVPRRHQFLVNLERSHDGGSFMLDTGVVSLPNAQRERGEMAIEGMGTLELTASPRGSSMQRIDVRELNGALQSLARWPMLSAFRYQRSAAAPTGLAMEVKRFADAGVLAAVADRAIATTLVTSEGRALTEITLHVQNRAQPYLKVALPAEATMVSVDVAGASAKPVVGADGTRVPLLRPGFRPNGPYSVSFVYLHAGTPFVKKGDLQMTLPKMDIPVGIVEWEVFVPERYAARAVDGNVIDRARFPDIGSSPAEEIEAAIGGAIPESVTVTAKSPALDRAKSREEQKAAEAPSQNVINLQKRAAGVLPVRVDVPRAGVSHQFVKPLVVDQVTVVNLKYKRR